MAGNPLTPTQVNSESRVAARLNALEALLARNKSRDVTGTTYGPFLTPVSGTIAAGGEVNITTVLGSSVLVDPATAVVSGHLLDGSGGSFAGRATWRTGGFTGTVGSSGFSWIICFGNPGGTVITNAQLRFTVWTP
jgi:hypothetical protein